MPTVFAHAVVATALGRWFPDRPPVRFWIWGAVCAMLPDLDVVGFLVGVRYDDMLGHRGLTHSLPFAVLVGAMVARRFPVTAASGAFGSRMLLSVWFAAMTATHGLLDALTDGGRGVAFLAPFSGARFFFPWRPIEVSPIGVRFFSARGLDVLASEARWILLPSAIIVLLAAVTLRLRPRGGAPATPVNSDAAESVN